MGKYGTSSSFCYAPYKIIIYGPEGIGKTLFAARFPDPVFLDTEGSTRYYDVRRIIQPNGQSTPTSWQMLLEMATAVKDGEITCKTLVIDSLDWAETLCAKAICDKARKDGIEDFGYGKGYTYLEEEFGRFLNLLNEIFHKGINIVGTAHAAMQRVELPEETGAYDHWAMKLEKKTAALVKEWADVVLFANYQTIVIKGANPMEKNKAAGGKRVMHSTHTPWWDAKNRFSLPEEMPLDFNSIASLFLYEQPEEVEPGIARATLEKPSPAPKTAGEQISMDLPAREKPPAMSPTEFEKANQEEELPFKMDDPPRKPPEGVPKALADLMTAAGWSVDDLRAVVYAAGCYPKDTPIANMDPGFFEYMVSEWEKFLSLSKKIKK